MKIYTSYYAKTKEIEKRGIFPVGISQIPPTFFKNPNFIMVAPTKEILFEYKNNPNKERYISRYKNEVLDVWKNPQIFIDRLEFVSGGKDVALCCYEKPEDFCHRHLLAQFLNDKLNLDIQELKFEPENLCLPLF